MEIRVLEKYGGRRKAGEGKFRREVEYEILGADDADTAFARFFQHLQKHAMTRSGLPLVNIDVDGNEDGAKLFTGTATYTNRTRNVFDVGIPHYSFSTKGGTAKVTFARQLIQAYGEMPPDFGCGINFVKDKGFEGVDIVVPKWTKTVKIALPRTLVSYQFEAMLRRLTGCFNSHPFLGMMPGECFFNGADATEGTRSDDNGNSLDVYELTFEFLGMPNVTQVIPGIGPVDKRGWDYVWIFHAEIPDMLSQRMITYPRNAFVNQVYDAVDLNVLGF